MERFEHNSHRFRVEIQHDADNPAPWENEAEHVIKLAHQQQATV